MMNLNEMSNKDLRIKAAELVGFTDIRPRFIPVPWLMDLVEEELSGYLDGKLQCIADYPNDIAAAMDLALSIADRYWMELHTPFRVGDPFFAGFTPLGTSGWNGWPDNQCEAEKPGAAITKAFVLTRMQEEEK